MKPRQQPAGRAGRRDRRPAAGKRVVPAASSHLQLPPGKRIAALVIAEAPDAPLQRVMQELDRLPLAAKIVAGPAAALERAGLDGESAAIALDEQQDPPRARSRAAEAANEADILLFVDGSSPLPAASLLPCVRAVARGADVAVADARARQPVFSRMDAGMRLQLFLNTLMRRKDLGASSLMAYPHAMTSEAARRIGYGQLDIPPLALAAAMELGLRIVPAGRPSIPAFRSNPAVRAAAEERSVGDHLAALHYLQQRHGPRLTFPDRMRNRSAGGWPHEAD